MESFYVFSQIVFSLNVESQNKHREDIFSLHEPFECVFSIYFFSRFWIKKQIQFDFMEAKKIETLLFSDQNFDW